MDNLTHITAILDADQVELHRGTDLPIVPISWLWDGWLARGKLHILAGAPGTGKTTIALALGASISIGGRWPDSSRSSVGNVLIWSGEDDPSDTLLPRFIAQGGNRERVYFVGDRYIAGESHAFDPARDVPALIQAASKIGDIRLIIVDPVVNAVAGDSHKNTEVRRALAPLVDMAARMGAAVLGITHFSKGTAGRDPVERVTGSIAFGALARIVLAAAKGEGDQRLFVRSKSNIGPDGGGFDYVLEQTEIEQNISASRILWGGPIEGSAQELLESQGDQRTERDEAADWLKEVLTDGPLSAKEVKTQAEQAGFSWRTVRRAKDEIGIKPAKTRFDGGWTWSLPKMTTSNEGAHPENVDPLGKGGHLGTDSPPKMSTISEGGQHFEVGTLGHLGRNYLAAKDGE